MKWIKKLLERRVYPMNKNVEIIAIDHGWSHIKTKNAVAVVAGATTMTMMMTSQAFAAGDTSAITQPLDNLKTLVIAVIGAVGVIILAKNVMEFAQAYQQQDSSTMNSALKGIVAGVMMAGISAVLTFLGF